MPRDFKVFLEDILEAIGKIQEYTQGMSGDAFGKDEKTLDAVIRNLEVIGEAVKKVPDEIRVRHSAIEWKKIGVCGTCSFMSTSELTRKSSGTSLKISFRPSKKI